MSQHVIVKDYNFDYPKMYQEEEKKIKKILKDNLFLLNILAQHQFQI